MNGMQETILAALGHTFSFSGWPFANEAEFKHELFHQLAEALVMGIRLVDQVPGTPSCRLHCEGKVENGNAQKADILICNPHRRQRFNYDVEYVLELKQRLSMREVGAEAAKFQRYRNEYKGLYLIAERGAHADVRYATKDFDNLHVLDRSVVSAIQHQHFRSDAQLDFESARQVVAESIDDVLTLYGNGNDQYHSFFWCNYEHEIWRGHSFPCEGDFNAHLYHRLRLRLPSGVEIRSEVHPHNQTLRVDLVVRDSRGDWIIPIDVKMNWDQFKPAYRRGQTKAPEADVIVQRLGALAKAHARSYPIIVVIQFDWQLPRDIRARALPLIERCAYPIEIVGYSEDAGTVFRKRCGP